MVMRVLGVFKTLPFRLLLKPFVESLYEDHLLLTLLLVAVLQLLQPHPS